MPKHESDPAGRSSSVDEQGSAAPEAASDSSPVFQLLSEVERQFDRLRQLQRAHDPGRGEAKAAAEGDAESAELDRQREAVAAERDQLEAERSELQARRGALEQQAADQDKLQKDLETAKAKLTTHLNQIESGGSEELEQLRARVAELEQAAVGSQETLSQLDQARSQIAELQQAVETLQPQLAERDAQLQQKQQEIDAVGQKIRSFSESLGQQTAQLERGAAAIAKVQEQQKEIERLKKDLAKRSKDASGDSAKSAKRMESMAAEIEDLKGKLAESARAAETIQAHEATIAEQAAEVQRLTQELQEASKSGGKSQSKNVKGLKQRISELETALKEAKKKSKKAGTGGAEAADSRLRAVAAHLQLRHARLKRVRRALAERKRNAAAAPKSRVSRAELEKAAQQRQAVHQERHQLREARHRLAAAEKKMMRKWARPKAISTVTWLLVLAVLVGGISWLGTSYYFPPTISASVTVEAKPGPRGALTEEELAGWKRWHTDLLTSSAFLNALAVRVADRRLESVADADVLAKMMTEQLTVDDAAPAELTLTLAGTDKHELLTLLDLVAATILAESHRQADQRLSAAKAVVRGSRTVGGRVHYAALNSVAIEDHRHVIVGPFFAVAFTITLLLVLLVYRRLIRAKRIFDESGVELGAELR